MERLQLSMICRLVQANLDVAFAGSVGHWLLLIEFHASATSSGIVARQLPASLPHSSKDDGECASTCELIQ